MTTGGWILLGIMFSFSASALLIWFWGKRNGVIEEDIKYRMLKDE